MTNRTLKIIVLVLAAFVLSQGTAFAVDKNYSKSSFRNPFKSQLPRRKKVIKPSTEATKKDIPKREPVRKRVSVKTQPVEIAPPEPPTLVISGLVWNSDRPQAIINSRVIDVGDTIETIQVVAIRKEGVEIEFQGKTITIEP